MAEADGLNQEILIESHMSSLKRALWYHKTEEGDSRAMYCCGSKTNYQRLSGVMRLVGRGRRGRVT